MSLIISQQTHYVVNIDGKVHLNNGQILLQNKSTGNLVYVPFNKEIAAAFNISEASTLTSVVESNEENDVNNSCSRSTPEVQDFINDDYDDDAEEATVNDSKLWSPNNVTFLIQQIEEHINDLDTEVKKEIYIKIAKICTAEFKKPVKYEAVDSKWKSLKRTYKKVILHNNTSGKQRRYWRFFQQIHNFMYNRPEITPLATSSSCVGLKLRDQQNVSQNETKIEASGTTDVETSFGKKRRLRETDANKRHKEKMARMDEFNQLFKKMVEKMPDKD